MIGWHTKELPSHGKHVLRTGACLGVARQGFGSTCVQRDQLRRKVRGSRWAHACGAEFGQAHKNQASTSDD